MSSSEMLPVVDFKMAISAYLAASLIKSGELPYEKSKSFGTPWCEEAPDHMETQWMHSVHHFRWAPTFNVQPQLLSDYNYMKDPTQGGSLSSVNLAGKMEQNVLLNCWFLH